MPIITYPSAEAVIDKEDMYATVSVLAASTGTVLVSRRLKGGKIPKIVALRNAVDAAGANSVTFRLRVNGEFVFPYDGSQNQWGAPEQDSYLPIPINIPQFSLVEVVADNSHASSAFNATARCVIFYFDPPGFGRI